MQRMQNYWKFGLNSPEKNDFFKSGNSLFRYLCTFFGEVT